MIRARAVFSRMLVAHSLGARRRHLPFLIPSESRELSNTARNVGAFFLRYCNRICVAAAAALVLLFGVAMAVLAVNDHPMSFLDEHVHYDTQLKMHEGTLSYRGALYEERVVDQWSCGVGHEAGGLVHGCGDPRLDVRDVTSGQYTTGYIHYPTYFVGAEAFRLVVEFVFGPHFDLSVYRLFSAFLMFLGVAACGMFAYVLGIRKFGLIASVSLPVAATSIAVMGGMLTPNSTAILAGALIAGTGLLWMRRGKGFIWLSLAVALGSTTAVINSLAAGGFLAAILIVWFARKRGWRVVGDWHPRIWHFAVLALIIVTPVIAWGRYISVTATVSNAEVYGPYQLAGWSTIVVGALQEVFGFHSPWTDWSMGFPPGSDAISRALRAVATGIPLWVTILVVGALVFVLLGTNFNRAAGVASANEGPRSLSPMRVLAFGTLVTIILYPAALRISNAFSFGIDYGIVTRYSMAFAPLLVLLVLVLVRQPRFQLVSAAIGGIGLVAIAGVPL